LSTDRADTFDATLELAHKSGLTFAQFVMLTPFCGTVDFERWEKRYGASGRFFGTARPVPRQVT